MPPWSVTIATAFNIPTTKSGLVIGATNTSPFSTFVIWVGCMTIFAGPLALPLLATLPLTKSTFLTVFFFFSLRNFSSIFSSIITSNWPSIIISAWSFIRFFKGMFLRLFSPNKMSEISHSVKWMSSSIEIPIREAISAKRLRTRYAEKVKMSKRYVLKYTNSGSNSTFFFNSPLMDSSLIASLNAFSDLAFLLSIFRSSFLQSFSKISLSFPMASSKVKGWRLKPYIFIQAYFLL